MSSAGSARQRRKAAPPKNRQSGVGKMTPGARAPAPQERAVVYCALAKNISQHDIYGEGAGPGGAEALQISTREKKIASARRERLGKTAADAIITGFRDLSHNNSVISNPGGGDVNRSRSIRTGAPGKCWRSANAIDGPDISSQH